jgi:hypothetical protein
MVGNREGKMNSVQCERIHGFTFPLRRSLDWRHIHNSGVRSPPCTVVATLLTPESGQSEARKLHVKVVLPQMDSFQISSEKASDTSYYGSPESHDLEGITKVGWDGQTGTPVDSIPTPVAGPGNKENLRVAVPWPAPSRHAPLYIWLRGEQRGRLTTEE